MRYMLTEMLEQGMKLGQNVFDIHGKMYYGKQDVITEEIIKDLSSLEIRGVYIDDEISKGISYFQLPEDNLRLQVLRLVGQVYQNAYYGKKQQMQEIEEVLEQLLEQILQAKGKFHQLVKNNMYEEYLFSHDLNVAVLSGMLAMEMGLEKEELRDVLAAALFHDIGKMLLVDEIPKDQRLLPQMQEKLKKHCETGARYIRENLSLSERVALTVEQHHEWYNGKGYPNHSKGKELLRTARILRVADTFDALSAKHPYREAMQPGEIKEYIFSRVGMEFDPRVVEVMVTNICVYPVASQVKLSDGRLAIVEKNHPGFMGSPTVRMLETGESIHLRNEKEAKHIYISQMFM